MFTESTVSAALLPNLTVQLTDRPVLDLLAAAEQGYRLYELFALRGEDELAHFVDAELRSDTPQDFPWWPSWHWQEHPERPWRLELNRLGALFRGPSLEHAAWLAFSAESRARELTRKHWPQVLATRERVRRSDDALVRYELDLIDGKTHPNDVALAFDTLSPWLGRWFRWVPSRTYSERQYALLSALLALPIVRAFSHRGRADMAAIRCAINEQRQRCSAVQSSESDVFPVRVLGGWTGGGCFDPDSGERVILEWQPAWMRGARLQSEGLQIEGLFFDENGVGGLPHDKMERAALRDGVPLMLVDRLSPERTPLRRWFDLGEGWWLGVDPAVHADVAPALEPFGVQDEVLAP